MAGKVTRKKYVDKFIQAQKTSEPELEGEFGQARIASALYWYSRFISSDKKRKGYVVDYAKENDIDVKVLKRVPDKLFDTSLPYACRLISRGLKDDKVQAFVDEKLPELMEHSKDRPKVVIDDEPKANKPTIQDRIKEQVKEILAEVDHFVDAHVFYSESKSVKELLGSNDMGGPQTKHIIAHIDGYIKEYETVKKDKKLFEEYNMKIRRLNRLLRYLQSIKEEAENYLGAKKKARKTTVRKKKVKTPFELCKWAKYSEDTILKPTKIIGAGYAVILNTKYNILTFLHAEDPEGLSFKGTTIINFDEKKSQMFIPKRGVEIEKIIKELSSKTGIRALKNYMRDETKLKVRKGRLTGRTNDNINIVTVA